VPVQKGQNLIRCWEDKAENCVGAGKQRYKFCRAEKKLKIMSVREKQLKIVSESLLEIAFRDSLLEITFRHSVSKNHNYWSVRFFVSALCAVQGVQAKHSL